MEWIVKDRLLDSVKIFQPSEPCYEAVTCVHAGDYVDGFIKGSLPLNEMRKTGFHWSEGLVKRCFLEVGMIVCENVNHVYHGRYWHLLRVQDER